jgi:lipopolysaccharide biosynthesis glycosyltransferase
MDTTASSYRSTVVRQPAGPYGGLSLIGRGAGRVSSHRVWLLFGCDDAYSRPLAVALASTLGHVHADNEVNVVIVDNGISPNSRSRLDRVARRARPDVQLNWVDAASLDLSDLRAQRHISASSYLRLFVDLALPTDAARVVYLDSDLLVRTDIAPLHDADLRGKTIGAVRDMAIADFGHPWSGVPDAAERGLLAKPYFNAGVLVIDLERWRGHDRGGELRACARSNYLNLDQDPLNDVLRDDWHPLELTWNVQAALVRLHALPPHAWVRELASQREQLVRDTRIVHFSWNIKPWHAMSTHPYVAEWHRELRRSSWYGPAELVRWTLAFHARQAAVRVLRRMGRRPVFESLNGPIPGLPV